MIKPIKKTSRKAAPAGGADSNLKNLAGSILELGREAVTTYTPIVDAIIDTQSRDVRQIEHTLDGLLGFCFDSEALVLYKKLRRHYLSIDPVTTVEYVNAYREMWGPEKGNGTLNAASTKMT